MNKVALVTGASRGIGAATAALLAQNKYSVCINYKEHRRQAEELSEKLNSQGYKTIIYGADVSDAEAVRKMVKCIRNEFGEVSLLVNNAGIAGQIQFQDITQKQWNDMISVNLGGCFNTIQAVLPDMLHYHSGSIVNVSSIWGQHGASCEVAYSVTKHAIIGLTRSLAAELAPSGISVNCVAPGVIDTDMVKVLGQETLDMLAQEIPVGRLGKPEEIAQVIYGIAHAPYTTGQVITSDGGFII